MGKSTINIYKSSFSVAMSAITRGYALGEIPNFSQCPEARNAPHEPRPAFYPPWPAERRVPRANVADGLPPMWHWVVDDWMGLIGNMHGYI